MKKILIIEDDAMIGKILEKKLSKNSNYEIIRVFDGAEGLKKIITFKPDLISVDLMMPGINGFEVLANIDTLYKNKTERPYLLVLSNLSSEDDIKKATKLGANHFFTKSNTKIDAIVEHINQTLV